MVGIEILLSWVELKGSQCFQEVKMLRGKTVFVWGGTVNGRRSWWEGKKLIIVSTEEKNAVEKGKLKKEMVDGNAHCARLLMQCARIVFPALALRKDWAERGGGGGRGRRAAVPHRSCWEAGGCALPLLPSARGRKRSSLSWEGRMEEGAGTKRGAEVQKISNRSRRLGTYFYNCSINCSLKSHKPVFPVYWQETESFITESPTVVFKEEKHAHHYAMGINERNENINPGSKVNYLSVRSKSMTTKCRAFLKQSSNKGAPPSHGWQSSEIPPVRKTSWSSEMKSTVLLFLTLLTFPSGISHRGLDNAAKNISVSSQALTWVLEVLS